jgi:hypothetical protein
MSDASPEGKHDGRKQTDKRQDVPPAGSLAQVEIRKHHEDRQGNGFLEDFELIPRKLSVPEPVRRHLKAVLAKRDQPADDIAATSGAVWYFRWPYQAMVMKLLEMSSSITVRITNSQGIL